ncbi:helix-turn-helix domain-containing protein [Actinomyces israelii]|uniref:helix-turn-helix domain-containing protein n=1 Tax=Actinomyces israelii TaxID=1659 RepID=UPI000A075670|nr:AraC family transcriptional regulator [Actinomyces israelii]
MMAGDRTLDFAPGQVTLMGPHLPHNWLSDLAPGESLARRDVLCQVLPERLAEAAQTLPELAAFETLVDRSRRGIVLTGASAAQAAELLIAMGRQRGLGRLGLLLALAEAFLRAPEREWSQIVSRGYVPSFNDVIAQRVNKVLSYIEENLDGELSMEEAASRLAMSPSAFSRFFRATAGLTFSALVRRRRIARACHLLRRTDLPVARIAGLSGYTNLASFNRRFKDETGTTPTGYRRTQRAALGSGG